MIKIKNIIKEEQYLTLATFQCESCNRQKGVSENEIQSWPSRVYYWIDDKHFYFVSRRESLHVQHIMHNNNISFIIHKDTERQGVQIKGHAEIVNKNLYEIVKLGGEKIGYIMTETKVKEKIKEYTEKDRVVIRLTAEICYVNVWKNNADYRILCKINEKMQLEEIIQSKI